MTSETRTLIELADISGIELECPKCGGKILYPLKEYAERLMSHCPNCNEHWFVGSENIPGNPPQGKESISDLIGALRAATGRTDIRARIRLQVSNLATIKQ